MVISQNRFQNTLGKPAHYSGIGLHTGEVVSLTMLPAKEDTGVVFRRVDLSHQPEIPATIFSVCDTSDRCTTLGNSSCKIYTVEHLMAALYANRVDNVMIEISNIEPPVGNGSSDIFVDLILQAGVVEQKAVKKVLAIQEPVYYSQGEVHLVALPSTHYRISYTLHYPHQPALKSQFAAFDIIPDIFNREISPCRTFCLYNEVAALMDKGLIKGGSLDNGVVVLGEAYLSKKGLFFKDEPVRHKILDAIGDLALLGVDLQAHILAIRAGHAANYELAKKILLGKT